MEVHGIVFGTSDKEKVLRMPIPAIVKGMSRPHGTRNRFDWMNTAMLGDLAMLGDMLGDMDE